LTLTKKKTSAIDEWELIARTNCRQKEISLTLSLEDLVKHKKKILTIIIDIKKWKKKTKIYRDKE